MDDPNRTPTGSSPRAAWRWHLGAAALLLASPVLGQGVGTVIGSSAPGASREVSRSRGAAVVRVNLSSAGVEANGTTDVTTISADGRTIAFSSVATNLVTGDVAGLRDVFVFDSTNGLTTLVSRTPTGDPGSGASGSFVTLSGDGRFVAFDSWASDLVTDDANGQLDIFVHDRATQTTERVSVHSDGTEANGPSAGASVSADGRWVTFSSWADNLVDGDINGVQDVFLHDRQTGITRRITETPEGVGGEADSHSPAISPNGRFIAYSTRANNLVSEALGPYFYIFVHDTWTGETTHASKNSAGEHAHWHSSGRPAITSDGRFVAFASDAYNLVYPDMNWVSDVFLHDRQTGETTRVSVTGAGGESNGGSIQPSISEDGRYVAFVSSGTNLVAGDDNGQADVFVYDRATETLRCASQRRLDRFATGTSTSPTLTADGSALVFTSDAPNLVRHDTNGLRDVFVSDPR